MVSQACKIQSEDDTVVEDKKKTSQVGLGSLVSLRQSIIQTRCSKQTFVLRVFQAQCKLNNTSLNKPTWTIEINSEELREYASLKHGTNSAINKMCY